MREAHSGPWGQKGISEVCHTAMLSGKPDARAPMESHRARVASKCHRNECSGVAIVTGAPTPEPQDISMTARVAQTC